MAKPDARVYILKEERTDGNADETGPTLLDGYPMCLPVSPGSESRMSIEEARLRLDELHYMGTHLHDMLRHMHHQFDVPVVAQAARSPLWEQLGYFFQSTIVVQLEGYIADRPRWESEKMRDVLDALLATDETFGRFNDVLRMERWIERYLDRVFEILDALGCAVDPELRPRWKAIANMHHPHDVLFTSDDVIGTSSEEEKIQTATAAQ